MKKSIIEEMASSHAKEFRFLVECLKTGKLPIQYTPIKIFEPGVARNPEQLLHGVVRSACLSFEEGRLFDFDLMPNTDIIRLSTHLKGMEDATMHPPFEDWRFCFAATSDFKEAASGMPKFATNFYVVEGKQSDAVQVSEFVVMADNNGLLFSGSIYIQLPISATAIAVVIGCSEIFVNQIRALIDSMLDPCLASLVMLNTKGVDYTEKKPPRPERRRAEKEGVPAPSHWQINASEYFTALRHTGASSGGDAKASHASPIPHIRRGHSRTLSSGKQTWVRDCLVNVKSQTQEAFVERSRARIAYKAGNLL